MIAITLCVSLAAAVPAAAEQDSASTLHLVQDGRATCMVVVPKDLDPWTSKAAGWLGEYMEKATGVVLPVVSEDSAPSGTLISVGHTQLAQKAGIETSDLKWDGSKLVVQGDVLFLIGRDSTQEIKSHPLVGARGTCRAVLTFLEDYCGVRWFLPTPMGEVVPHSRDISVPRDLAKTVIPAFAYCDGRATYSPAFLGTGGDTPASIINNFRIALPVVAGGHTYYHAVPADQYFNDHPEYFALIDGQRTRAGNHLCTSNPDVRRLLLRWTQERFDEGFELVAIGQTDGYRRCECPDCERLDDFRWSPRTGERWEDFQAGQLRETPCDRLFLAHQWVIDEVRKSHPDRKVLLMCYAPTAWPSRTIPYFGDNCIAEIMNLEPEYIEAWRGKVAGITAHISHWFNIQTPMGMNVHATPHEVAEKIRYLHDNGCIGLYQIAETNWGFHGPMYYELGKLMGDPSRDWRALVEEYCHGVYGQAGGTMLEFYDLLYGRLEDVLPQDVKEFSARNTGMPRWLSTSDLYLMQYPPSFLDRLEGLLDKAQREADSEQSRGWVRHTRDYFDFTKLLTHALISYRAYQANPSPENRRELKDRVEAFDAYRMQIITYPKEYTERWFPGHAHFCNWLTANVQHESKVYYIPWDERKPDVLRAGIKGTGIGYGGSYYYSFVKEPLTLDLSGE